MKIERSGEQDFDALVALWERSVRATHDFLTEADIASLCVAVREEALPALELWIVRDAAGALLGFMGLHGASIEALFVDPEHFRRGAGRALLDHAKALRGPLSVDVNEQNPLACEFYLRYGFRKVGRSPLDSFGRPFPILHYAMAGASPSEGADP